MFFIVVPHFISAGFQLVFLFIFMTWCRFCSDVLNVAIRVCLLLVFLFLKNKLWISWCFCLGIGGLIGDFDG